MSCLQKCIRIKGAVLGGRGTALPTMLKQCCNHLNQCRNNVATLCYAKNRCYESSRATSPLNALTTSVLTCCLYLFAQSRSSRISVSPSNIPNTAMRQAMNQTRGKFQKTCKKPRGRTQQIFIRGGYARLFGFQMKNSFECLI